MTQTFEGFDVQGSKEKVSASLHKMAGKHGGVPNNSPITLVESKCEQIWKDHYKYGKGKSNSIQKNQLRLLFRIHLLGMEVEGVLFGGKYLQSCSHYPKQLHTPAHH